jgi:hypothetical protein
MSAADAAAAFARMTSTAEGATAFGIAAEAGADAAAAGGAAGAAAAAAAAGGAAPQSAAPAAAAAQRRWAVVIDPVLLNEVNNTIETHPATTESMTKLLTGLSKRDKFRFFAEPVTDAVVSGCMCFFTVTRACVQLGCCVLWTLLASASCDS